MALQFQIDLEGEKEFSRTLLIAIDGLQDFEPPLKRIGGELHKTFQLNFDQQGALFGKWAPRKPIIRAGQRIDTWPLLEKSGTMKASFYETVNPLSLQMGNKTPYFIYHQSKEPRERLPRRIMMKIDEDRRNFIVKALQAYIVTLLRGGR